MDYLARVGDQVLVDAGKRNWYDYDVDAHLRYHAEFFSHAPRTFDVVIDATHLPYVAITHVKFMRALCEFARVSMKERLNTCRIVGAPYAIKCLYHAFATSGLIAEHTQSKITFNTKAE